jgi:hypothetical protein
MSNPGQDGNTRSAAFAGGAVPPTARTATPANVPARRIARESDIVRLLLRSDSPAVEGPRSRGATQAASLSLDCRPALIARPTVTVPLADAPAHCCCQCAAGQPGHDLGDPGAVAWGRSLGCRPIWATAAVRLGDRPFGELRPALAWRDDLREDGGALDDVRALLPKGKNFSCPGCIRRPMGHPPGPTTCTAVRGAPPLREKVVSPQRTTKAKVGRSHSLPLLAYSRLGGLRQDPGRSAESAAGPRTDEDMGPRRACVSTDGGRGDEPLVGVAVRLLALGAEVRVCAPPDSAQRPADSSEGRQPETRTCRTRGSTELETPVIRPASAGLRSTAAPEVSQ